MFEVLVKGDHNEGTESLFVGTEHDCRVFLDAYLLAIITHTSFTYDEKTIGEDWVYISSTLVSLDNFAILIVKR